MRKLLILSVLSLMMASSAGCFHRNTACGGLCGTGMFGGWRPQQPTAEVVQYAQPCCPQPVQCCPQPVQCCPQPVPCCP